MKKFKTILSFELSGFMRSKSFMGVTVLLVVLMAVVMYLPQIMDAIDSDDDSDEERPVMAVTAPVNVDAAESIGQALRDTFAEAFPDYDVRLADSAAEAQQMVVSGQAECAFVDVTGSSYTYLVNDLSMYDTNTDTADAIFKTQIIMSAMTGAGLSYEEAEQVMARTVTHTVEALGEDQSQNFFYTYIMIMALYFVILLYGQMVATHVAEEKDSRAMELLITSADPVSMMFGKVVASCLAGFVQLVALFGSAALLYAVNGSAWNGNVIIESIFGMPLNLLLFMLLFFVLGFFLYAFMFGAAGSVVSKVSDVSTTVMPITLLFIVGFMVVVFSMSSGDVNNTVMRVCSYVPFTSPMAMFTRIAMSSVPAVEIIISVAVLIGSVFAIGFISAKIYRAGVLLYGNKTGLGAFLRTLKKS